MTDQTDTVTPRKPVWCKLEDGDRLTFSEWFGLYVSSPIKSFRRACRVSPELRERCVKYAIEAGAKSGYDTIWEAERLVKFIAEGKE